jgi:hypothetical protein
LNTTTRTKAKLVYPLAATGASLAVLDFPCVLAIELVVRVYLKGDTLIVLLPFLLGVRHHLHLCKMHY